MNCDVQVRMFDVLVTRLATTSLSTSKFSFFILTAYKIHSTFECSRGDRMVEQSQINIIIVIHSQYSDGVQSSISVTFYFLQSC